jgi:CheY-like chemotaxis protein
VAGENVLIVDDNELNRELTRTLLQREGYEVMMASGSDELLLTLRTFSPRIILMDIELAGMNGLQITRQLKADPQTSHITVVAITAYPHKADKQKALAAGCAGYITKPVRAQELSEILQKYIDEQS